MEGMEREEVSVCVQKWGPYLLCCAGFRGVLWNNIAGWSSIYRERLIHRKVGVAEEKRERKKKIPHAYFLMNTEIPHLLRGQQTSSAVLLYSHLATIANLLLFFSPWHKYMNPSSLVAILETVYVTSQYSRCRWVLFLHVW